MNETLPQKQEKRAPGNMANYELIEGKYRCKTCRGDILITPVAHSVHSAEMPGAGMGEVRYTQDPYCPNCEIKPNFHGAPIVEKMFSKFFR